MLKSPDLLTAASFNSPIAWLFSNLLQAALIGITYGIKSVRFETSGDLWYTFGGASSRGPGVLYRQYRVLDRHGQCLLACRVVLWSWLRGVA